MEFQNDYEIKSHLNKIKTQIMQLSNTEGETIDLELERIDKLSLLNDEKLEILKLMKDVAVQRDKRQVKRINDAKASYAAVSDDLISALKDFAIVAKQLDVVKQSHEKIMHLAKQAEFAMNITGEGDHRLNTVAQKQRMRGILVKTFGIDVLQGIKYNDTFSYMGYDLDADLANIKKP